MPRFVFSVYGLVAVCILLGSASGVSAAPMVYPLLPSSQAVVFVNNGTETLLDGGSFTTGLSGTVVMDIGAQSVDSFAVGITPNTVINFCGICSYGGATSATIESATVSSSTPFTGSATPLVTGLFSYTAIGAEVNGVYSVGGGSIPISYGGTPITFQVNSLGTVVVTGQNLGAIDGSAFGEAEPLNIAANLTMILGTPYPVPEPGTAVLVLLGLAGLAGARRRQVLR